MAGDAPPTADYAAQPRLTIVPLSLDDANTLVGRWHRHHIPVVGHKFSIGVADEEGAVHGAAIVGRPVSRVRDDGFTLEVTRLVVSDGIGIVGALLRTAGHPSRDPNACSMLYAAAWRAARAMGYRRIGTYTLVSEPGTSLRAAGWLCIGSTPGRSWSVPSRPRVDKHPLGERQLWEVSA